MAKRKKRRGLGSTEAEHQKFAKSSLIRAYEFLERGESTKECSVNRMFWLIHATRTAGNVLAHVDHGTTMVGANAVLGRAAEAMKKCAVPKRLR